MREAWRRQVGEATSWTNVRGPAGAVLCEMKDLGITVPSWKVLRLSDNRMTSMKDMCPRKSHKKDADEMCKNMRIGTNGLKCTKLRSCRKKCGSKKSRRYRKEWLITDGQIGVPRKPGSWTVSGAWTHQKSCTT